MTSVVSQSSETVPLEDSVYESNDHDMVATPESSFDDDDNTGVLYVAERRRWVVLAAFSFGNLSNAMLWVTFAPVASLAEAYFDISATAVNSFSASYMAAYIPGSLLALWVYSYKEHGLYRGIVLGAVLSTVGALLRCFAMLPSDPSFGLALTGQCLAAMAQPLFTNVPPKVAAAWFPSKERDIATVMCSMASPIGTTIGSILPAIFVMQDESTLQVSGFHVLLLVEAIIVTFSAVCVLVFVRSHPVMPPSAAAEQEYSLQTVAESTWAVLSRNTLLCFRNKHFLVLFSAFGIGLGIFNALATLTEQLIRPFCYTGDDASLFTGLLIGCGLVGSGIVGVYLDKTHEYTLVLKVGFCVATLGLLVYSLVLRPDATAVLAVCFALLGFVMLPMLPTALEAAVECTWPVPEEYSSGLIMSAGQVTGIVYIFGLEALANRQSSCDENAEYYFAAASGVMFVSVVVATVVMFLYHGPLLRLEAEQAVAEAFT